MEIRKEINPYELRLGEYDELMAESNEEAKNVLEKVSVVAMNEASKGLEHGRDQLAFLQTRLTADLNFKLAFDDMNIRGQQLVDAFEWAGGDAQKLYRALQDRDEEMVKYVNHCTAERYDPEKQGIQPIAVRDGASFIHNNSEKLSKLYMKDLDEAKQYLINDFARNTIDYSRLDINAETTREEGIKIAEAHGFRLGLELDTEPFSATPAKDYLFINDRGDILTAHSSDKDFCYGGCEIHGTRKAEQRVTGMKLDMQENFYGERDKKVLQFTTSYDNNHDMFHAYEQSFANDQRTVPQEMKEIGGNEGIPIPEYFKNLEEELKGDVITEFRFGSFNRINLQNIMNLLKIEDYLPQMSEECRKIYEPITEHALETALEQNMKIHKDNTELIKHLPYIQEKLDYSKDRMTVIMDTIQEKLCGQLKEQQEALVHLDSSDHWKKNNIEEYITYISNAQEYLEEHREELFDTFEEYDHDREYESEQSFDDYLNDAAREASMMDSGHDIDMPELEEDRDR